MIPHYSTYMMALMSGVALVICVGVAALGWEASPMRRLILFVVIPVLLVNMVMWWKWFIRLERDRNEGRWDA